MANEIKELSDWADKALTKGDGPPPGYTAIPGGKKGGYRKPKAGGGWSYVYTQGSAGKSKPEPEHDDGGYSRAPLNDREFTNILNSPDQNSRHLMGLADAICEDHERVREAIQTVIKKRDFTGLADLGRKGLAEAPYLDRPVWDRLVRIADKAAEHARSEKKTAAAAKREDAGKSKPEPEHEDEGSSREPISAKAFSDMMSDPDWTTGQLMDFAGITGLNHEDILDAIRVVVRKHNYAGLETLARKSLESASTLDRPVWARLARIASKAVEIEAAEKAATDKAD